MASLWRPPKQPGDFDLEVDRRDWDTGDAEPPRVQPRSPPAQGCRQHQLTFRWQRAS